MVKSSSVVCEVRECAYYTTVLSLIFLKRKGAEVSP